MSSRSKSIVQDCQVQGVYLTTLKSSSIAEAVNFMMTGSEHDNCDTAGEADRNQSGAHSNM